MHTGSHVRHRRKSATSYSSSSTSIATLGVYYESTNIIHVVVMYARTLFTKDSHKQTLKKMCSVVLVLMPILLLEYAYSRVVSRRGLQALKVHIPVVVRGVEYS